MPGRSRNCSAHLAVAAVSRVAALRSNGLSARGRRHRLPRRRRDVLHGGSHRRDSGAADRAANTAHERPRDNRRIRDRGHGRSRPTFRWPGSSRRATGSNSRRARSRRASRSCGNGRRRLAQPSGRFPQRDGRSRSGPSGFGVEVPLAPLHHIQSRRTCRMVSRDEDSRTRSSTRFASRTTSGVAVTLLGGGSNVLIGDRGVRGPRHQAARRAIEQIDRARVRADAAITINGLVRWTIQTRHRGPRSVGRHAGYRRRRDFRQRAFRRPADWRARRIGSARGSRRRARAIFRATKWNSATIEAACRKPVKCCCRPSSACRPAIPRRFAMSRAQSLAYRKKTQPLDTPSAGCIFQNPDRVGGARRYSRLLPARSSIGRG